MDEYDRMIINAFYLEPPAKAALDSGKFSIQFSLLYSQAISMKRMADQMERAGKIEIQGKP